MNLGDKRERKTPISRPEEKKMKSGERMPLTADDVAIAHWLCFVDVASSYWIVIYDVDNFYQTKVNVMEDSD